MQLYSAFSLPVFLTADFAVNLFIDGGNVTEEKLLETTRPPVGVMDVLSTDCAMCSLQAADLFRRLKQKENCQ